MATKGGFTTAFITEKDKDLLNTFVEKHPDGTIHQLWEWGVFQTKTEGRDKFWAIVVKNNQDEILASAVVFRQTLPFGKSWIYCPRGPLFNTLKFDTQAQSVAALLFSQIGILARQENALFLRFDPPFLKQDALRYQEFFTQLKARNAHAHYQPESTLVINLNLSEPEILAQMKPKGRYNIKVARRHNVVVKESGDIESFYQLFTITTARDGFQGHSSSYYRNMMELLGPQKTKLFFAYYANKPLAAAIVTYFKSTATYYFGASSHEHRETMAPYLLHWHIMQEAKAAGYSQYDLFGIAPESDPHHAWAGVTQFKTKFGGIRIDYIDPQEIVYKPLWYLGMKIVKRLLR